MDEDELKRRTKLFGLRIIKLVAALPNTIHAKIIGGQWSVPEHQSEQITVQPVEHVQRLSLFPGWESLKKKQMKVSFG